MFRILVVDDHDVVRKGVRSILKAHSQWGVCGEAENGIEALQKIAELKPDLAILDISMPEKDGLAVATELTNAGSPCKSLVLTMHNSTEVAAAIRRTGARGYVVKSHAAQLLEKAVEAVLAGEIFFSSDQTETLIVGNPE